MRLSRFALVALLAAVPLLAHNSSDRYADSYVLRLGDVSFMNGQGMSVDTLKQLKNAYGKRFLWFRRGGKAYVVGAEDVLARAEAIVEPQRELGRKQGALGAKQAALGGEQASLGTKQAELGAQQARTSSERGQSELNRQQRELGDKQNELGKLQDDLGREQDKLGEMQDRLSRQVEQRLSALAGQCIRNGIAKEVER